MVMHSSSEVKEPMPEVWSVKGRCQQKVRPVRCRCSTKNALSIGKVLVTHIRAVLEDMHCFLKNALSCFKQVGFGLLAPIKIGCC